MRIFSVLLALFLLTACGIKSAPIAKDTLNIPVPDAVILSLQDDGVLIRNNNPNYQILAERALQNSGIFTQDSFERVSLIAPNSQFVDTDVEIGGKYIYRFKNYNERYNTFSRGSTKNIVYSPPVSLSDVVIKQYSDSACVITKSSNVVDYSQVIVNGRDAGNIYEGMLCFDLPNSLVVNIMLIPYDFSGNAGIPYEERLKRDEVTTLLPPQNAKALREGGTVILTWDDAKDIDSVAIYIRNGKAIRLLQKTDITLFKYTIPSAKACVDFELASIRDNFESDRVKITSCP